MTDQTNSDDRHLILGIDPGSLCTGYGIVSASGRRLECVDFGAIHLASKLPFHERLQILGNRLQTILAAYPIRVMALESVFFSKNAQSSLKLGHVRGVALYIGASAGLDIYEYSPASVKMALAGYGRAIKDQVQFMVQHMLHLKTSPQPADASDALAVAICHANSIRLHQRTKKPV